MSLPPNYPALAISYNNIAVVYGKRGEFSKTLPFHQHGLDILQRSLPANHLTLLTLRDNIEFIKKRL